MVSSELSAVGSKICENSSLGRDVLDSKAVRAVPLLGFPTSALDSKILKFGRCSGSIFHGSRTVGRESGFILRKKSLYFMLSCG